MTSVSEIILQDSNWSEDKSQNIEISCGALKSANEHKHYSQVLNRAVDCSNLHSLFWLCTIGSHSIRSSLARTSILPNDMPFCFSSPFLGKAMVIIQWMGVSMSGNGWSCREGESLWRRFGGWGREGLTPGNKIVIVRRSTNCSEEDLYCGMLDLSLGEITHFCEHCVCSHVIWIESSPTSSQNLNNWSYFSDYTQQVHFRLWSPSDRTSSLPNSAQVEYGVVMWTAITSRKCVHLESLHTLSCTFTLFNPPQPLARIMELDILWLIYDLPSSSSGFLPSSSGFLMDGTSHSPNMHKNFVISLHRI